MFAWIAVLVVISLLGVLLAILIPRRISVSRTNIEADKETLAARNDLRSTILQATAAVVLAVGAGATVYQVITTARATNRQLELSRVQLNLARQQISLTAQAQVSQQFMQAVGQLLAPGSNESAKLGGIYTLGLIPTESLQVATNTYRDEITNLLAAFVVARAGRVRLGSTQTSLRTPLNPVVQAALDVLFKPPGGLRLQYTDVTVPVQLSSQDLNLRLGKFRHYDFELVNMSGDSLDNADFTGAHLNRSCLGDSVFEAKFGGAWLLGADLSDIAKDANSADFTGAHWDKYTKWPSGAKVARNGVTIHGTLLRLAPETHATGKRLSDACS